MKFDISDECNCLHGIQHKLEASTNAYTFAAPRLLIESVRAALEISSQQRVRLPCQRKHSTPLVMITWATRRNTKRRIICRWTSLLSRCRHSNSISIFSPTHDGTYREVARSMMSVVVGPLSPCACSFVLVRPRSLATSF